MGGFYRPSQRDEQRMRRFMRVGAMGIAAVNTDPTAVSIYNKIVAWWEHAVDSTNALLDSHTGGYNATATGSFAYGEPALASGLPTCTKWTANTSFMGVGDAVPLRLSNDFSVMCWFKRDAVTQPTFPKIFGKYTDAPNGRATYAFFINTSTGKLIFRFNSASSYFDATGATTLANSTTYCAIGTKLSSGSELYLNNSLDATQASGGTPDTNAISIKMGQADTADGMIGWQGSTALFSSALTSTERAYLYNSGNGVSYATLKTAAGH